MQDTVNANVQVLWTFVVAITAFTDRSLSLEENTRDITRYSY